MLMRDCVVRLRGVMLLFDDDDDAVYEDVRCLCMFVVYACDVG